MLNQKNRVIAFVIVFALVIAVLVWANLPDSDLPNNDDKDGSGMTDMEIEKSNLIRITSPRPGQTVTSPIVITGEARGNWYFEASFPIVLVDWDGKIIAQSYATAQGEWMTEEFVPFKSEFSFDVNDISGSYSNRGTLILRKDNPSGLPEFDDALEIPVIIGGSSGDK